MRRERGERGFTLIELMVSLVLFSFAIAGVLAVAVSMSRGFHEQRAAVSAEGAVRIPLDFIADALRQASPGSPTGTITDTTSVTCSTTALKVVNNQTSINDSSMIGWDELDVIYASGAVVTSTRAIYDGTSTTIDVTDASQLAIGDFVVISDTAKGDLFKIADISGSTLTLNTSSCGTVGPYATGALVIRAQHAVFTIDAVDGIPTLMMDPDGDGSGAPEPLAEGIEDMQITLGVDQNGDGKIGAEDASAGDADEWQGNNAADTVLAGVIRAVRITLIARTTSGLVGNAKPFRRPAAEDNPQGVTPDTYRRRVLRTVVEVRNMAGSP